MNGDLEHDLAACGDLQAFVTSLRGAPQARVPVDFTARVMTAVGDENRKIARWRRVFTIYMPLAASVAICLGVAGVFRATPSAAYSTRILVACQRTDGRFSASSAASYIQAFAVTALARDAEGNGAALGAAVDALVREQNEDGGWANADLSARNVVALRAASDAGVSGATRAYKRGLRYLRTHGIGELSAADLSREAKVALARVGRTDRGLACSAALCAAL